MVKAFEKTNKVNIPYEFAARRDSDLPAFWADSSKAKNQLDWTAKRSLDEMMMDTWNWQNNNPDGY